MSDTEDYDPKPIEKYFPIEEVNKIADKESKAKRYYRPVYTMHKWWARRLGSVFRTILLYSLADKDMKVLNDGKLTPAKDWSGDPEELWNFYLEDVYFEDKTVLDPFMGGGTSIVEAIRMGANVIGKDINPVAWFVTKKEVEPVDLDELDEAYRDLEREVAPKIKKYYKTTCPVCGETADAMYYFWVKELDCRNCGHTTPLFKDYRVAKARSNNVEHKSKAICSNCGEVYEPGDKCPNCGGEFDHNDYYHIHCSDCGGIFQSPDYRSENTCPHCGNEFNPYDDGNATGKYFTCTECGQKNEVIETIGEQGKPEERLWGVEYYCPHCDMKGYKPAREEDKGLYREAAEEYEEKKNELPIPEQKVPEGVKTRELTNHGYEKFKDMFNKRQLLNLGTLFKAIKDGNYDSVKEYLILTFSYLVDLHNTFCRYEKNARKIGHLFQQHAYIPRVTFTENNVWGTVYGRGTFEKTFDQVKEGVKYSINPFEKYKFNGKTQQKAMEISAERSKEDKIRCGDASLLEVEDASVDLVLTDPPYYDNVMYSELSDFFYVWLREALKDDYEYFQSELTPKRGEVIKNKIQGKDETDFSDGLKRVFNEAHSKLKPDGLMAFTFHHKETNAWASALQAILESGFFVTAVYPIQAEMGTSLHIQDKGNIEYDMIIVCRKKQETKQETSWATMQDEIYFKAREAIHELEDKNPNLSQGDKFVVAMGKCLEEYSKHYPNVIRDGEKVGVQEALEDIREIVDTQFMSGRYDKLSEELDKPTATYLSFIAGRGGEIDYGELNKELQQRSLNINSLIDWGLVKKEGSKVVELSTEERADRIEGKKNEDLTAIDRAFYIKYLKDVDQAGDAELVKQWGNEGAVEALEELGEVLEDDEYEELADYVDNVLTGTKTGKEEPGEQQDLI